MKRNPLHLSILVVILVLTLAATAAAVVDPQDSAVGRTPFGP